MIYVKICLLLLVCTSYGLYTRYIYTEQLDKDIDSSIKQLDDPTISNKTRDSHVLRTNGYILGWSVIFIMGGFMLFSDVIVGCKKLWQVLGTLSVLFLLCGCWQPFEPIQLEVIQPNEEAFLLPFTGDPKKQSSTNTEEYFRSNLVFTQQVRIPQQWVSLGYETTRWNGEWRPAAILVKVDKSPVTREWTADINSGTSNRNEAIWVMTADQVEFSTGWTCTARIANRDDAVKFLHNYPNGTLEKVMDHEIRAKLQAEFGLEVTDLPMDELRKLATPHITKVSDKITEFFKARGIQITNLGITGGFVYKDKSILDRMVEIFNAEQEKTIRVAKTQAQEQENKKIMLEAEGKAKGLLIERKAEADGIKMVADAKAYEIEKAKQSEKTYLSLKTLELQKSKIEKWDGKFPNYYMSNSDMNALLQIPMPTMDHK